MAEPHRFPAPEGTGIAFVTGGFGFLGGAVASALKAAGWRVALIGHGDLRPHAQAYATWAGDVGEPAFAAMADAIGLPELVFHAAGGAAVGASLAEPARDRERTVESLKRTLTFLKGHAPQARLIYPSSAAVYGAGHAEPIPESARLAPVSPYGEHKAEAEALIADAAAGFGLSAVILRFFSLYGPGLRKQLLWDLAQRLSDPGACAMLGGSGDEQRDFLCITDAVALVGLAVRLPTRIEPLILNGGSGQGASIRDVAEAFAVALGAGGRVRFSGRAREGDPKAMIADIAKARALGFEPATPLETGLDRVAAWFGGLVPSP